MTRRRYTTVEEQVRYAVERVPVDQVVRISVRDLMFVHETLAELVRFFHQPAHWTSLEDVEHFIGNNKRGALAMIAQCYYERLRDVWPRKVVKALESGELEHPDPPYYYDPRPHPRPPAGRRRRAPRARAGRPVGTRS